MRYMDYCPSRDLLWEQRVAGSNPVSPTILTNPRGRERAILAPHELRLTAAARAAQAVSGAITGPSAGRRAKMPNPAMIA